MPNIEPQHAASGRVLRNQLETMLETGQNADGGWGFHTGQASRVEPTCWAIRALSRGKDFPEDRVTRGLNYLKAKQLSDGSWPSTSGSQAGNPEEGPQTGGWMTSLACSTLATAAGNQKAFEVQAAIEAGLQWLCDDYPQDSTQWFRFLKRLHSTEHVVPHDDEFRGWGWTPRTSSWVEPTASALMAFAVAKSERLEKAIAERRALAIGLLYDRMCPGGGWNCGNPRVYGVDGESLVLPTCWALLALRNGPEHPKRELSLAWLKKAFIEIESAGSLAVATMTMEHYETSPPEARHSLCDWTAEDLEEQGSHVMAWVVLALNPARRWPAANIRVVQ